MKNFDTWNSLKKNIDERKNTPFANQRDIWWCSLGLNVGTEEDGKNELFERPVLVLKVFNKNTVRVIPLTSKTKSGPHNIPINYGNRSGSVIISQIKTISTKRLSRKLARISRDGFDEIIKEIKDRF